MPFTKILSDLVDEVDGSLGAIFLDDECEYVQYFGHIDSFRHKLLGAYQGILFGQVKKRIDHLSKVAPLKIVSEYENAQFITIQLKSGYFLVLAMDRQANIGKAMKEIERVAEIINREII
ncbi:MAG: hypothetical protein JXQ27_03745 [Acidobacteria bacterium]|nr:hypothetical protein [Acidobacteriota bacterium]